MSDLHERDEVTLVATITVRYSAERGTYKGPGSALPSDAEMARIDLDAYYRDPETILSWAAGPQDVTVEIRPEGAR